ncbi:hypothetical protein AB5I41_10675 [Sphingomonas sp. MMS24-JH45]
MSPIPRPASPPRRSGWTSTPTSWSMTRCWRTRDAHSFSSRCTITSKAISATSRRSIEHPDTLAGLS